MTATVPSATTHSGKCLVFQLDREEFAIPVQHVREIMRLQDITPVPHTPDHLRGVLNLRGKIVPVVDLRRKFGFCPAEDGPRACIVVVELASEAGPLRIGCVVDSVSEVLPVAVEDVQPTPDFGDAPAPPYLLGVIRGRGGIKMLLDIQQVLGSQDTGALQAALGGVEARATA